MCFSAPVSFVASGILGATGLATLTQVKEKTELPFALMPLLFAVHQFMEGLVWIGFGNSAMQTVMIYIYLAIATSFWATYFPVAIYMLEDKKNKIRRKILKYFIGLGIFVSITALTVLLMNPVSVEVVCNSLSYYMGTYDVPWYLMRLVQIAYAVAGVGCLFVAKSKLINIFGFILAASFVVTSIVFYEIYFSVWCFFGAILSLIVFFYFRERRKLDPK